MYICTFVHICSQIWFYKIMMKQITAVVHLSGIPILVWSDGESSQLLLTGFLISNFYIFITDLILYWFHWYQLLLTGLFISPITSRTLAFWMYDLMYSSYNQAHSIYHDVSSTTQVTPNNTFIARWIIQLKKLKHRRILFFLVTKQSVGQQMLLEPSWKFDQLTFFKESARSGKTTNSPNQK